MIGGGTKDLWHSGGMLFLRCDAVWDMNRLEDDPNRDISALDTHFCI